MLSVEPYKGELLPLWRFRTPELARSSATAILQLFHAYGRQRDFVGMDMARKFLQMGFTRARRYANREGGRKYAKGSRRLLPRRAAPDPVKAEAAKIFYAAWRSAAADPLYAELKGLFLAAQSTTNPHDARRPVALGRAWSKRSSTSV